MKKLIVTYTDGSSATITPDVDALIAFEDEFDTSLDNFGRRVKHVLWVIHYMLKREKHTDLPFGEWLLTVETAEPAEDVNTNPTQPQA